MLADTDLTGAQAAFRRAIELGHLEHAAAAANMLGVVLARENDLLGAEAAFREAIESGHPDHSPDGWLKLSAVLAEQGRVAEARAAAQNAIKIGDEVVLDRAQQLLRSLAQ